MTKRTSSQDRSDAAANSSAPTSQRTAYIMLSIIIIGLVALIGWFAYLLMSPDDSDQTPVVNVTATDNTNTTNSNKNTTTKNKNTNSTTNTNADNSNATNEDVTEDETESEAEDETTNENTNSDEGGLVEPDEKDDATDEAAGEANTLYFAASGSACGEVVAVEREFELGDDPYGEIILTMMQGPEDEETGSDGIPGTVGLRQVEYTADGALVTVNEGYNELDECAQATVDAQFIETANAMFDLPEGTQGTVVVGEVEADTEGESESTEETNTETE